VKNSREHAQKLKRLYRTLKRKSPDIQTADYDEPADAVVYAIIAENITETAAQSAIKRFDDYFIDLNDLRVSPIEEIIEVFGEDTPVTRDIASTLTRALRAVFNEYHVVSLTALRKIGKRPAKRVLEKLDGTTDFVVNYCMLTALQAHAIPLTKNMIEYLKSNELVHADADEQQIQGFLMRQISAKNGYEFYALLRRESELAEARKKKKARRKTATRKAKTKRRTKTKEKT